MSNLPPDRSLAALYHPDIAQGPITALPIDNVRIHRALTRAGIRTLGELLAARQQGYIMVRNFGDTFQARVEQALRQLAVSATPRTPLPDIIEITEMPPNLLTTLPRLAAAVCAVLDRTQIWTLLQHRFGLGGAPYKDTGEIAAILNISPARVYQIDQEGRELLRQLLETEMPLPGKTVPTALRMEAAQAAALLTNLSDNPLLPQKTAAALLAARYAPQPDDPASVPFLLFCLGFNRVSLREHPRLFGDQILWLKPTTKLKSKHILQAAVAINRHLREQRLPVRLADLPAHLYQELQEPMIYAAMEAVLPHLTHIEILPDNRCRIRTEALASVADMAYRLLHDHGQPMRTAELVKAIHRHLAARKPAAAVSASGIVNRFSHDPRLESIGQPREWLLVKWRHPRVQAVLGAIEAFLSHQQEPATMATIHEAVSARCADATRSVVRTLLKREPVFVRTDRWAYGLAAWQLPPYTPPTRPSLSRTLALAIREIYRRADRQTLPLGELIAAAAALTGLAKSRVAAWVWQYDLVTILDNGTEPAAGLLAQVNDVGNPQRRRTVTAMVAVRSGRFLQRQPHQCCPLVTVRDHILAEMGINQITFYTAFHQMDNVTVARHGRTRMVHLQSDKSL